MARLLMAGLLCLGGLGCAEGRTPPAPTAMVTIRGAGQGVVTYAFGSEQACKEGTEDDYCGSEKPPLTHPVMTVEVPAFLLDEHEVTNLQYQHCVARGACSEPSPKNADASGAQFQKYYDDGDTRFADYPVINVTWLQAFEYCQFVGKRLPTEFEWEAAARTADSEAPRRLPFGDTPADCLDKRVAVAACNPGMDSPQPVRDTTSDDVIIHDGRELFSMVGNVSEWVSTPYVEDVTCEPDAQVFQCVNAYDECKGKEGSDFAGCADPFESCESCVDDSAGTPALRPECYAMCFESKVRRFWICERRADTLKPAPEGGTSTARRSFRGAHYKTQDLCDVRTWVRTESSGTDKKAPTLGFRCAKDLE